MTFPSYLPVTAEFFNVSVSSLSLSLSLLFHPIRYIYTTSRPAKLIYMHKKYALPINAFVWLFAVFSWFAWGKRRWAGLNSAVIERVLLDDDGRDDRKES